MNKREQKAIETAADNCEVLRARLARYEDAEGRPVSTLAEQAQQIQRLQEGQDILILARDEQKRLANEYRDLWSRAAVKAQPSGVVLADDIRAACQNAVEVFAEETNAAQCREVAEYMREVLLARLNSSPVSAGEPVYQFQCREIGEGDWRPCDHIRYMYCQKSPEMDTRVVQVLALSAPSHDPHPQRSRLVFLHRLTRHTLPGDPSHSSRPPASSCGADELPAHHGQAWCGG